MTVTVPRNPSSTLPHGILTEIETVTVHTVVTVGLQHAMTVAVFRCIVTVTATVNATVSRQP